MIFQKWIEKIKCFLQLFYLRVNEYDKSTGMLISKHLGYAYGYRGINSVLYVIIPFNIIVGGIWRLNWILRCGITSNSMNKHLNGEYDRGYRVGYEYGVTEGRKMVVSELAEKFKQLVD